MPPPRWSPVAALPPAPRPVPTTIPAPAPAGSPAPVPSSFSDRGRHAAPHHDEPIYTELVAEWQLRGRMLPGQRDREWVELVTRSALRPVVGPGV